MSDSYNVDDILAEINNKKTPAGSANTAKPTAPSAEQEAAALQQRRAARVNEFMQTSFAAHEDEEIDEDDLVDLDEIFGKVKRPGLQRQGISPDEYDLDSARPKKAESKRAEQKKTEAKKAEPKKAEAKKRFVVTLPDDDDDGGEDDSFSFEEPEKPTPHFALREKLKKHPHEKAEKPPREGREKQPAPAVDAPEYRSPIEAGEIRADLKASHKRLLIRLIITAVCFVAALYLSLCNLYALPLAAPVCPENNMQLYILCCLLPLIVSAVVSFPVLGNGIPALIKRRAGHDTSAALCLLATLIHTAALLATGSLQLYEGGIYTSVACLSLMMNSLGKLLMICRIERNFAVVSSGSTLCGEQLLTHDALAAELTGIPVTEEPSIVYCAPADFGSEFLSLSYSPDSAEQMSRTLSPMLLIFGVIVSLLCRLVFKTDTVDALGVLCIMLCMASALSETLVGNLPLWRAAKTFGGEGTLISGSACTDTLGTADAVAVEATELYPAGSAVLHGIKALRRDRIDDAIVNAASVLTAANGTARDVFLETIGGKTDILRPVESYTIEQGGICARIGGQEVLYGDRSLLTAHGVHLPSLDLEERYVKNGRDGLYLAQGGEAIALFIIGYRVSRNVEFWLHRLEKKGMGLIIHTSDPYITPAKIERDYAYPAALVRIVPASLQREYGEITKPRAEAPAYAMSIAGSRVRLRLVCAIATLRSAIRFGTLLQTVGLLLGYVIATLFAFFGRSGSLGFFPLLLYQLFWCAASVGIPSLMRF